MGTVFLFVTEYLDKKKLTSFTNIIGCETLELASLMFKDSFDMLKSSKSFNEKFLKTEKDRPLSYVYDDDEKRMREYVRALEIN